MSKELWHNDKWYTSYWNFDDRVKEFYKFAKKIEFHDVSLRDGEQQSGLVFRKDQKIAVAEKLAELGIHRIEAGMPAVSKQDEEAIREIVKRNFGPKIFSFARCMVDDVKMAADMGVEGIITEIPANELLIKHGYKWETQKAIDACVKATRLAHESGLYVVLFLIDESRADFNYLTNFIDHIDKDGYFDSLAIVDTVGVLNPLGAYFAVQTMKERYPGKRLEVHFHDDFGLGSAATLMGLAAGAEVAHTTIGAIGERAGNTGYEEVALSLLTMFGQDTGLKYEKIYPTAQWLFEMAGITQRPNRGILGPDISKMYSGLPVLWYESIKKTVNDPLILFPYRWSLTGHPDISYTIGKMNGNATVQYYLREMGLDDQDEDKVKACLLGVKNKAFEVGRALTFDEFKEVAKGIYK